METKPLSASGATFGGLSILSSYNICHNACLGVIAALSIFGIGVVGFPLAFLIPYQIYFWIFGISFLIIALILYKVKGPCISKHAILANAGLLVSGIPFIESKLISYALLAVGISIAVIAVILYFKERRSNR